MQRVLFQQPEMSQFQSQASRVLAGHGTAKQEPAINDEFYDEKNSVLWLVVSVFGNVIGGTLLLSGMFILPHVLAGILD